VQKVLSEAQRHAPCYDWSGKKMDTGNRSALDFARDGHAHDIRQFGITRRGIDSGEDKPGFSPSAAEAGTRGAHLT
jgi:hypothetical protein